MLHICEWCSLGSLIILFFIIRMVDEIVVGCSLLCDGGAVERGLAYMFLMGVTSLVTYGSETGPNRHLAV